MTLAGLSPEAGLVLVTSVLNDRAARGDLAPSTVAKATALHARFTRFLSQGHKVSDLAHIRQSQVLGFLSAPALTVDGTQQTPSDRTRDNRRWALALYFATLRDLGVGVGDPLANVRVSRGAASSARPLTDEEEALGRKYCIRFTGDARGPAAWAIVGSGATTGEAAALCPNDIDWDLGFARIEGGVRASRRIRLDAWAIARLRDRLADLDATVDDTIPLLYSGSRGGDSQTSTVSQVIARILRRSGLAAKAGVKPSSLTGWAGRRTYDVTGDLFAAQGVLGLRSLDDTARAIGLTAGPRP